MVRAAGGSGGSSSTSGNGGSGGTIAGSIGDIVYRGGNAVAAAGGGAGSTGQGGDANGLIGGTGTLEGGGSGGNVPTGNDNGNSGFHFGGGGSGAIKTNNGGPQTGGSGADGQIVISWCPPPSITSQPVNQMITYGEIAEFSVLSGTPGVKYQWQVFEVGGDNWTDLVGEKGTALTITIPTAAINGNQYRCIVSADCGSFAISDPAILTVNRKELILTAGIQTVTYGTPEFLVTRNGTFSLSGFVNGENSSVVNGLNIISYTTNYTGSTNAGTVGITITPSISVLTAANYSFTAESGSVIISKADQYIICGCFPFSKPLNQFIDEPIPLNVTASSGLPVSITLTQGSAATLNYNTNELPPYYLTDIGETGVVTIYVTQAGNENYNTADPVAQSFDVTKSNQSISFPEIDDMTYSNGLTLSLTAIASSGLDVIYTVESGPATITGNTLNISGAGEIWVTASQPGNVSYNQASDVTRSFTVYKSTQTITINVPAGETDEFSQITASSTSGLPVILSLGTGSDATWLMDQGSYYALTGIGTIGSGEIYIVGSQAGDGNFLPAAQVIQTIDLNKQNQIIAFEPIADKTYTPSLTLSLFAIATSGLTVSLAVLNGPATLSGSTLTITGAGTVEIEASQSGNGTYNPAPSVTQQFQVTKATPVILQAHISKTFGDADFSINPTSASSGSFSFVSGNTEVFTLSGNEATIVGAGSTILNITQQPTANYFGATKTVSIIISKAISTITVTGDTEYTYNALPQGPETNVVTGSAGPVSYSYKGTGSTSYGSTAAKPTNAGAYQVTATVSEDLNYAGATSLQYAFAIIKADAAINVNPYSVIYDGTEYISTGSATGVASENLSGLDLSETVHTNSGNYNDSWTFTDVTGNYNDASGTVDNIIFPKNLTITASNQIKCFGEEFIFSGIEFTSSGLVAGETVGSVTLNSSGASAAATDGNHDIVLSGANDGTFNPNNYVISYVNGQMTVKPQPTLSGAEQSVIVCEGTIATIHLSGLLPEKIFSLDYTIDGVKQTTKTGLYSDASGNSGFTTPALSAGNDGQTLRITGITITSETPNCFQTFSEEVTLSVNPLPTLSGASLEETVCEGTSATINLSGLLAGNTFTLFYTIDDIDQTPVEGLNADASGNVEFITPVLSAANNGKVLQIYGIEITSETPACYQGFTQNIILDVVPASIGGTSWATDEDVCSENYTTLNLSGYTGAIQWQQSDDGSTGWVNVSEGSGIITETFTTPVLTETIYYRAEVTNGICSPAYSNVVAVIVYALPATGEIIPD